MHVLLLRVIALGVLGFALWDAWHFPVFAHALVVGLALYALALSFEVRVWLVVLPPAMALLSLGFWSGRYFWDAFDLFILVTLAGGLWSRVGWWPGWSVFRLWPIALFAAVQALTTVNGLYPLEAPVAGLWTDYYASTNALREGKAVLWALLLVPMMMQAQRLGGLTAKWWVGGMSAGVLSLGAVILWERHLYTGILNLDNAYRVSGWFFDLHTGGASIDVALAMMLPFLFGIWIWWRRWPAGVAMSLMLALGAYGLLVTFSRANYPAVGAIVVVLLLGLSTLPGLRHRSFRPAGVRVYLVFAVLLVLTPLMIGGTIAERFKTTAQDLQTRLAHWGSAVALVNPGVEHWTGIGKGAFPRWYHISRAIEGERLPTIFRHEHGSGAFVRFSASDQRGSLDLRQRFGPTPSELRLEFSARTFPGTSERLLIEFCERHVLRVRSECDWVGTDIADTQGAWRDYSKPVSVARLGTGGFFDRSPLDISILNRGIRHGLDIASVRLIDAQGRDLLANRDFAEGTDRWYIVDGNHLRWHVKNLFVYAYVEGGLLGLSALLLLVAMALLRCWRLHRAGDPVGMVLAASIAAGLAIGLFDSILDAPRVAVLFLLPVFAALAWRAQPVELSQRFVAYPVWMPRPAYVAAGMLAMMVAAVAGKRILSSQLTVPQAIVHYGEKLGFDPESLLGWVNQPPPYRGAALGLQPVSERPGIWRDLSPAPDEPVCNGNAMEKLAVCWAVRRDLEAGEQALAALQGLGDVRPRAYGEYGNGWLLAVVYDLLSDHPGMNPELRRAFQSRLRRVLGHYLLLLNSNGPAIWHGRATLAAQAMIIGAALDEGEGHVEDLLAQVHYHYLELLESLAISEAWPEGYNYWVNSRGFLIALAGYAYLNAFPGAAAVEDTRRTLSRIGLWHIHNARPDLKAVQIGDEGPRIDLREETQRIVDVLALATGDPWLSSFSNLLQEKFGQSGYYRAYRWWRPLLRRSSGVLSDHTLQDWALPTAAWFGPDAMNLVLMRSAWNADATMLSFRAGATFSHHGHYDAGHFTLFKGAPLAVTGATYRGDVGAGHRIDYGVRTVSKNSLLIMRPGEKVRPQGYARDNVADGGQRLAMPLRNRLSTLRSWEQNLDDGLHLEGGRIIGYRHEPNVLTYVHADITDAYNTPEHDAGGAGGKVSRVSRQLIYLRRLDRIVLRDWIEVTDPAFAVKWLLQSMVRPELDGAVPVSGEADNGIFVTGQSEFRFINGRGRLHLLSLRPETPETLVIGGKDFRFFVDVDGDARTLDGRNMGHNSRITSWFEPALWRLEISGRNEGVSRDFLTVLSPSLDDFNIPRAKVLSALPDGIQALQVDDEVIVFVDRTSVGRFRLPIVPDAAYLRIVGLPAQSAVIVDGERLETSVAGTVWSEFAGRAVDVSWHSDDIAEGG